MAARATKIVKGKTNATQGPGRVAGLHGRGGVTAKGRGGHPSTNPQGRVVKCG